MIKKTITLVVGSIILIATCTFSTCEGEDEYKYHYETPEERCHNQGQLYCSNAEGGCCKKSFPYTDGHGTCWETLSGCRKTGWACTKCW